MKLAGIGRVVLVAMAVFVAVWLCVIVYWRTSGAAPGGLQMLLLLGALPLALLSTIWLVRRVRASRTVAPGEAGKAASAGGGDAASEVFEPTLPLACLAGALRLPCGDDAGQVLAQLQAPPRPGLHPKFKDRDGLPVFAAHVEGLETEGFAERAAFPAPARSQLEQEAERVRAMALLEPVAEELFDQVSLLLTPLPVASESVVAGLKRTQAEAVRVAVRVHVLLPLSWATPLRQAVGDWLLELALASGIDRRRVALDIVPADGALSSWGLLDAIAGATGDDGAWRLVLAASSLVGERSVQRLVATGRLMDSRNSDGIVPGEGAAGVLLRPPTAPPAVAALPAPLLHRASRGTLAVGANPRAAANASGELMAMALQRSAIEPDAIACVLSDADQRPARAVEASAAASAACPEFDIATQGGAIGVPCGDTGHVAPIALLALAAAQARASQQAVLLLSLGAGQERMAAVMAAPSQDPIPEQAGDAPDAAT